MRLLLIILLATLSIASASRYEAEVLKIKDADTFLCRVELWPKQYLEVNIRVLGIDAAEKNTLLGAKAKDYTIEHVGVGRTVYLTNIKEGKFAGRMLASVEVPHIGDWATHIEARGFAKPYFGGNRKNLWKQCQLDMVPCN